VLHHLAPFNDCYGQRVTSNLCQLVCYDASFLQTVEVKVMYLQLVFLVEFADCKRGAGDFVVTTQAAYQAAYKSRLTTAQVADKFNYLTALQDFADFLCEKLGLFGAGRFCLPRRHGTHMPRIVTRRPPPGQAPLDARE
jgi:hypothetical protein